MDLIKALETLTPDICRQETCFQDYLASLLHAHRRVIINNIEVDVYGNDLAIEVKVNPRIYDGVGQALVYKRLLNIGVVWLIHIFTYKIDTKRWCNDLNRLLAGLEVGYAVITPTERCIGFAPHFSR